MFPYFGKIVDIILINKETVYFLVVKLMTEDFNNHYHGFEVSEATYVLDVLTVNSLYNQEPLF